MKIIVTGGAGFIGGNFIHYMLSEHPEDRIVCLDKLTYAGNPETLAPVIDHPNFSFSRGDIADRDYVFDLFSREKPDAAPPPPTRSHSQSCRWPAHSGRLTRSHRHQPKPGRSWHGHARPAQRRPYLPDRANSA